MNNVNIYLHCLLIQFKYNVIYIYGLYIYTCFKDITAFPCAKLLIVPKDMAKTWLSNAQHC